jgi:hypothetical protein
MRQMLLALAVAALGGFMTASCGNSNNNSGDMGKDMAGAAGPDMVVAKVNCMGVAQCMYTCIGGGTDINTCATQCSKNAKTGSAQKWINAVICGQNFCVGDADLGNGKCVEVAVPGMAGSFQLCDPGTTYAQCTATTYMSTSCSPCIEQARNFWFEDSSVDPMNPGPPTGHCSMPTSADCMGATAACMTQFNACLNDP